MNDTRNLFRLQMAAKMARNSIDAQLNMAEELLKKGGTEGDILIALERKFFIARRPAEAIVDSAKGMLQ